jgi:putative ABC transport system permease protein
MSRVALRGLLGRKLRTVLTAIAIVLGVAMVSGTFVLTDTIDRAFTTIFSSAYDETDAVVTGTKAVEWSQTGRATVSADLLEQVRALPQVEAAAGTILDVSGDANEATIIDKEGEPIVGNNPTFGLGVDPQDERFNPFRLVRGDWASGSDEVVLDKSTASKHDFAVGDSVQVAGDGPVGTYTVTGIATFGDVDSLGGATIALFDVETAQRVLRKDGFDAIAVAGEDAVPQRELLTAIGDSVSGTAEVRSGAEQAEEDQKGIDEFLSFIRYFLLAFGGIALFVGAFVIFNTLSITVAQRTRELGTLRTLGASRRQVMRSVVLEGLALGVVASVIGIALGVALAKGLSSLFAALELDLPQSGTVFALRTALVSLAVGVGVTLLATIVPAVRATRIAPIAAVRDGGTAVKRLSRRTFAAALVLVGLSSASLVYATLGEGVATALRIFGMVGGALGLFVGVAMLAPRLVKPLAHFVGAPAARLGGAPGKLARENATRNPGRTASTAAALMIGLTLVTFVAVLGRGLLASVEDKLRGQVATSHVVTSQSGWTTVSPEVGRALSDAAGVTVASSVRSDRTDLTAGGEVDVSGIDPETITQAYRFDWIQGSDAVASSLAGDGALVREDVLEDTGLAVGDGLTMTGPDGRIIAVTIRGVFDPGDLDPLLGHVVITHQAFDRSFPRPGDLFTFVDGASTGAIERALTAFPTAEIHTKEGFVESRTSWVSALMNLFYVLLALSVVVSLFGMINTLVLSVFERTRELGMLRAVGMTRRQARRMIRHESVITALIGAALGLPLGIALAALVTESLSEFGVSFSLPVGTLVVFTLVAIAAGVLAAIAPARRASRLDVLGALQYE